MLQNREAVLTFSAFFSSDGAEPLATLSKQTDETFRSFISAAGRELLRSLLPSAQNNGKHQVTVTESIKFSALK